MSTTAGASLRPLAQSLKALTLRPIQRRAVTDYASLRDNLPRKVGMFGQKKVFHSPQADEPRRHIKIHAPLPAPASKTPIESLTSLQLATLDPTGAKQKMFSRHNPDSVKVGDILQVRRKNGEQPFAGVVINIRRRGVDSAFLLRGQVTRIGVEVWFKLYSPLIEGIDLVQRTEKRKRRAKLFYLRKPEHDFGSVANIVGQYMRQRAILRGEGPKNGQQGQRGGKTGKKGGKKN
ncbi:mitochondrial ribosomal protein-like protein [Pyronema domesticum]|uniref:Similar to 54S ribosomal protein IMG1, mitochondrial acc. no. P25626 n=1 Tax=Pyronema omphalodes (strain CBS 100304) TaxID=1076935 RepID=U4L0V9_PYROM|nr:mitochondrial ribosomal protein-like protein [Pyronema domesticum]CCX05694.1 Similar to 54S ribosomal protein IMG1, mitochondrial; acc. no. P25626 [Pyronema omphalodes CBS 100304]